MNTNLPTPEYLFKIEKTDSETGVQYNGDFVYRRLTIGEKIKLQEWVSDQIKSDSKDKKDDPTRSLWMTLAMIRFGCIECPAWFKDSDYGVDLYDFDIINEIFIKRSEKENEWVDKVKEKAAKVEAKVDEQ